MNKAGGNKDVQSLARLHIVAIGDDEKELSRLRTQIVHTLSDTQVHNTATNTPTNTPTNTLADGLRFATFIDRRAGLRHVAAAQPEILILSHNAATQSTFQTLRQARLEHFAGAVLIVAHSAELGVAVQMMKSGATDYIVRDQAIGGALLQTLRHCLRYATTERETRRRHAALTKAHDDLLMTFNHLHLGAALLDFDGNVRLLNTAAERLFECRADSVLGQHWSHLGRLSRQGRDALQAAMRAPLDMRRKVPMGLTTPGGRRLTLHVDVHNDPVHFEQRVLFFHDVTDATALHTQIQDRSSVRDLVGRSPAMVEVHQHIADLAPVDVTVLVEGETGTGKELVARAIHYSSPRATKPFVVVNCAGLSDSLLTSQLFGHIRGAFTGAIADHKGVFEAAHGGTILLDEIGDMPARVQTSLLRVLQEREVTRLGESLPRKIDVRVIAATHRDLQAEVESGRFRLDLLYRLRVARITAPPLRDRVGDIPLLARWFLRRVCRDTGKSVERIADDAMQVLEAHPWPGNVRELGSAIEVAVVRSSRGIVRASNLPLEARAGAKLMARSERERVLEALERTAFNRTAAAKMLGVSRATFYRRLNELGIDLRGKRAPSDTR